ncbi:brix domain-containing protein peter pan [Arctopsyche grandis]|uniref:brix domain-containing protein peter pan n=1 Tax=Arctopsyche grandis TaxID=121162 RepID=UPI00406D84B1
MGRRKGGTGRCSRKNRAAKAAPEPENITKAPHSFVIHRGLPSKHTTELTRDFRQLMEPFTASQLKERKNNSIKDFVSVAGYLHVSHMCVFSMTKLGLYLKISRMPRGPTLTFKVHNFSFSRDVISSLKKQYFLKRAFHSSPLIVMNSFSGEGMHLKLMANMFQNMFPTINVSNIKLKTIRRCVLLNYNPDTKLVDFRHYYVKMSPVGLTRGTKKIVQGKVPNLSRCADMAEFFEKAGMLSESEQEDDPSAQVVLPQTLSSRGARADGQSAVRLSELGPRLTMQLVKIEDGLMDGEVLFHEFINKTEDEKEEIRKKREAKRKLKENRKKVQNENVKQKEVMKEEHKKKSLDGIKKKKEKTETQRLMEMAAAESLRESGGMEEDDDAEYYRQEVGEEPEYDLFTKKSDNRKRRQPSDDTKLRVPKKKVKFDESVKKEYRSAGSSKDNRNSGKFKKRNDSTKPDRDGKKWKGGRSGHPKYGWKARNAEDEQDNKSSKNDRGPKFGKSKGSFKNNDKKPGKGRKVLGSKVQKFKKGFKKR